MTEKKAIPKPSIPKPTIRNTPPVKPPVTSADVGTPEEPKTPEVAKEDEPISKPASEPNAVETDLTKRFVGAFVDAILASVVGFIIVSITDSTFLQLFTVGLIFLVRDSIPMLDGQSPGKKIMNIKAVKEDGSSLSGDWVTGATRNILFFFPPLGLVECVIILIRNGKTDAGLRLGDDWAKTKVISLD